MGATRSVFTSLCSDHVSHLMVCIRWWQGQQQTLFISFAPSLHCNLRQLSCSCHGLCTASSRSLGPAAPISSEFSRPMLHDTNQIFWSKFFLAYDWCGTYPPGLVLSFAGNGMDILCMNGPFLLSYGATHWWRCVEGRGVVNSEKYYILGMQWFGLKILKEDMFGKCVILCLSYKILYDKLKWQKMNNNSHFPSFLGKTCIYLWSSSMKNSYNLWWSPFKALGDAAPWVMM